MSEKRWNVVIAGLSHDHIWGELVHWQNLPNAKIIGVAEADTRLTERFTKEYPDVPVFPSTEAMYTALKGQANITQIAAPNAHHARLAVEAFANGCNVITEKPMASTLEDADRMLAASMESGLSLMVNWPTAWNPLFQAFHASIDAGEIGTIHYIRYRSAHNGPKEIGCDPAFVEWLYDEKLNGAGAFMDYCCYGSVIAAYHLGLPSDVTGLRGRLAKDYEICDDNAVITMKYKAAIAVAEASWSQVTGYFGGNPVAYGSTASIGIERGKLLLLSGKDSFTEIEVAQPAYSNQNGPQYFVNHLETGAPIQGVCNPLVSRNAQAILQAGLDSSNSGLTIHPVVQSDI
jgi:predicted dehydrogenase